MVMVESLLFIGAGAGEKLLGAGQKWTGSATQFIRYLVYYSA